MAHVVLLGGSIAGLASAVALARRGHTATVVERDPLGDVTTVEEAFASWDRPGVPQFRQGHNFGARTRNLLFKRIPEVLEELAEQGIEEMNLFKAIAPKGLWEPEDDALTGLMIRRPGLELALRRVAEKEPGVTVHSPATAVDLIADDSLVPRVRGLALKGDDRVVGDIVLDCGGRRSPVSRWLASRGVEVPLLEYDCDASYYTRYFRFRPGVALSPMMLFSVRAEGAGAFVVGFPGDHDTFGLTFVIRPDDKELRVLRHTWAWDAMATMFPTVASWVGPEVAEPITDVLVMASHRNTHRRYVVDGTPIVLGLLPVGDSLCTTNPAYFWGASMALTYAFAAVDALTLLTLSTRRTATLPLWPSPTTRPSVPRRPQFTPRVRRWTGCACTASPERLSPTRIVRRWSDRN